LFIPETFSASAHGTYVDYSADDCYTQDSAHVGVTIEELLMWAHLWLAEKSVIKGERSHAV